MKKHLFGTLFFAAAAYTGFAQTPAISNPGFEPWIDYMATTESRESPESWYGSDQITGEYSVILEFMGATAEKQVFKSTDKHSGDFATRLLTIKLSDSLGNIPGILTNSEITADIDIMDPDLDFAMVMSSLIYSGGTPMYGKKVDSVSAWVKTGAGNTDNSAIIISAMKKSVSASTGADTMISIGSGKGLISPGESGYHKVSVPMEYLPEAAGEGTSTDTLIIAFLSSLVDEEGTVATEGNELFVDDVELIYSGPSSIHQPVLSEIKVLVHPNPAKDEVWFNLNVNERAGDYELSIADIAGRNVYNRQLTEQINGIDISGWAAGTYVYSLFNKRTGQYTGGKFIK